MAELTELVIDAYVIDSWMHGLIPCVDTTLITKLIWTSSKLESHILSTFSNVLELDCTGCRLTDLDGVQHLTKLEVLDCSDNRGLTSLNGIQNLTKLRVLNCSYCAISSLKELLNLNLEELYCRARIDHDGDPKGLTTLDGIQNSTNLKVLDCRYNQLTSLADIKGCSRLLKLNCSWCKLTSISTVSCFPLLSELNCSSNLIKTTKHVSLCPNLTKLKCGQCDLSNLQGVSSCTKLEILDCSSNFIKTIKYVGFCPNLTKLKCGQCDLSNLQGVSSCTKLEILDCYGNRITGLTGLDKCVNLRHLQCSMNKLTSLCDIKDCISIQALFVGDNQLKTLKHLSKLQNIERLECYNCLLTSLEGIKGCTNLERISCSYNKLSSLTELSALSQLNHLNCSGNHLATLDDIRPCTLLSWLDCGFNRLTSIEPVTLLTNLTLFNCRSNQITSMEPVVYLRLLHDCTYNSNPLSIQSARFERFIERYRRNRAQETTVYGDSQNVHDVHIQKSVCKSLVALLSDPKPRFTTSELLGYINDSNLDARAKELVVKYCTDKSVHSVHMITYEELLAYVWNRIIQSEHTAELIKILSQQICDSDGLCFTGRFNRTVSVLVGFYPDIVIEISDSSRISAIVLAVRARVIPYDVAEHRTQAHDALVEAGYDEETIQEWIEAISE